MCSLPPTGDVLSLLTTKQSDRSVRGSSKSSQESRGFSTKESRRDSQRKRSRSRGRDRRSRSREWRRSRSRDRRRSRSRDRRRSRSSNRRRSRSGNRRSRSIEKKYNIGGRRIGMKDRHSPGPSSRTAARRHDARGAKASRADSVSSSSDSSPELRKEKDKDDMTSFANKLKEPGKNKSLSSIRLSSRLEDTKMRRSSPITPIVFTLKKTESKQPQFTAVPKRQNPVQDKKKEATIVEKEIKSFKETHKIVEEDIMERIKNLKEKLASQTVLPALKVASQSSTKPVVTKPPLTKAAPPSVQPSKTHQAHIEKPPQLVNTTPVVPSTVGLPNEMKQQLMRDMYMDVQDVPHGFQQRPVMSFNMGMGGPIPGLRMMTGPPPLGMIPPGMGGPHGIPGPLPQMPGQPLGVPGPLPGVHGPPPGMSGPPPGLHCPPFGLHGPPPNVHGPPPNVHGPPPNVHGPPPNVHGPPHGVHGPPPGMVPPPGIPVPPPGMIGQPHGRVVYNQPHFMARAGPGGTCPPQWSNNESTPLEDASKEPNPAKKRKNERRREKEKMKMSGPQSSVTEIPITATPRIGKNLGPARKYINAFQTRLLKCLQVSSECGPIIKNLLKTKEDPSSEFFLRDNLLCTSRDINDSTVYIVLPDNPVKRRYVVTSFVLDYPYWTLDHLVDFFDQLFSNMPIEIIEEAYEDFENDKTEERRTEFKASLIKIMDHPDSESLKKLEIPPKELLTKTANVSDDHSIVRDVDDKPQHSIENKEKIDVEEKKTGCEEDDKTVEKVSKTDTAVISSKDDVEEQAVHAVMRDGEDKLPESIENKEKIDVEEKKTGCEEDDKTAENVNKTETAVISSKDDVEEQAVHAIVRDGEDKLQDSIENKEKIDVEEKETGCEEDDKTAENVNKTETAVISSEDDVEEQDVYAIVKDGEDKLQDSTENKERIDVEEKETGFEEDGKAVENMSKTDTTVISSKDDVEEQDVPALVRDGDDKPQDSIEKKEKIDVEEKETGCEEDGKTVENMSKTDTTVIASKDDVEEQDVPAVVRDGDDKPQDSIEKKEKIDVEEKETGCEEDGKIVENMSKTDSAVISSKDDVEEQAVHAVVRDGEDKLPESIENKEKIDVEEKKTGCEEDDKTAENVSKTETAVISSKDDIEKPDVHAIVRDGDDKPQDSMENEEKIDVEEKETGFEEDGKTVENMSKTDSAVISLKNIEEPDVHAIVKDGEDKPQDSMENKEKVDVEEKYTGREEDGKPVENVSKKDTAVIPSKDDVEEPDVHAVVRDGDDKHQDSMENKEKVDVEEKDTGREEDGKPVENVSKKDTAVIPSKDDVEEPDVHAVVRDGDDKHQDSMENKEKVDVEEKDTGREEDGKPVENVSKKDTAVIPSKDDVEEPDVHAAVRDGDDKHQDSMENKEKVDVEEKDTGREEDGKPVENVSKKDTAVISSKDDVEEPDVHAVVRDGDDKHQDSMENKEKVDVEEKDTGREEECKPVENVSKKDTAVISSKDDVEEPDVHAVVRDGDDKHQDSMENKEKIDVEEKDTGCEEDGKPVENMSKTDSAVIPSKDNIEEQAVDDAMESAELFEFDSSSKIVETPVAVNAQICSTSERTVERSSMSSSDDGIAPHDDSNRVKVDVQHDSRVLLEATENILEKPAPPRNLMSSGSTLSESSSESRGEGKVLTSIPTDNKEVDSSGNSTVVDSNTEQMDNTTPEAASVETELPEIEDGYNEPQDLAIRNYDKLFFYLPRLSEIQNTSDLSAVIQCMKKTVYSPNDVYLLKSGLLCLHFNREHSNALKIVLLKSPAVYGEIVSALTEKYPHLEFGEFMGIIESSFAYITPEEVENILSGLQMKQSKISYVKQCKIVNYHLVSFLSSRLMAIQQTNKRTFGHHRALRLNNNVHKIYVLKNNLVCSAKNDKLEHPDIKIMLPHNTEDQREIVFALHERHHEMTLEDLVEMLKNTFSGFILSKLSISVVLEKCERCGEGQIKRKNDLILEVKKKMEELENRIKKKKEELENRIKVELKRKRKAHEETLMKKFPNLLIPSIAMLSCEVISKIRQIQMSSNVIKAQIQLLSTKQSPPGSRYTLVKSLLSKLVDVGGEKKYRIVVPSFLTAELVTFLHRSHHSKQLPQFIEFVSGFMQIDEKYCHEAFLNCSICQRQSQSQSVIKNKKEKTKEEMLDWMITVHGPGRCLKMTEILLNISAIIPQLIEWQHKCKDIQIHHSTLNRWPTKTDSRHLIFEDLVFNKKNLRLRVQPITDIGRLLVQALHTEYHDWTVPFLWSVMQDSFDINVKEETVTSLISEICARCREENKASESEKVMDSELANFYTSIEPLLEQDDIEPSECGNNDDKSSKTDERSANESINKAEEATADIHANELDSMSQTETVIADTKTLDDANSIINEKSASNSEEDPRKDQVIKIESPVNEAHSKDPNLGEIEASVTPLSSETVLLDPPIQTVDNTTVQGVGTFNVPSEVTSNDGEIDDRSAINTELLATNVSSKAMAREPNEGLSEASGKDAIIADDQASVTLDKQHLPVDKSSFQDGGPLSLHAQVASKLDLGVGDENPAIKKEPVSTKNVGLKSSATSASTEIDSLSCPKLVLVRLTEKEINRHMHPRKVTIPCDLLEQDADSRHAKDTDTSEAGAIMSGKEEDEEASVKNARTAASSRHQNVESSPTEDTETSNAGVAESCEKETEEPPVKNARTDSVGEPHEQNVESSPKEVKDNSNAGVIESCKEEAEEPPVKKAGTVATSCEQNVESRPVGVKETSSEGVVEVLSCKEEAEEPPLKKARTDTVCEPHEQNVESRPAGEKETSSEGVVMSGGKEEAEEPSVKNAGSCERNVESRPAGVKETSSEGVVEVLSCKEEAEEPPVKKARTDTVCEPHEQNVESRPAGEKETSSEGVVMSGGKEEAEEPSVKNAGSCERNVESRPAGVKETSSEGVVEVLSCKEEAEEPPVKKARTDTVFEPHVQNVESSPTEVKETSNAGVVESCKEEVEETSIVIDPCRPKGNEEVIQSTESVPSCESSKGDIDIIGVSTKSEDVGSSTSVLDPPSIGQLLLERLCDQVIEETSLSSPSTFAESVAESGSIELEVTEAISEPTTPPSRRMTRGATKRNSPVSGKSLDESKEEDGDEPPEDGSSAKTGLEEPNDALTQRKKCSPKRKVKATPKITKKSRKK